MRLWSVPGSRSVSRRTRRRQPTTNALRLNVATCPFVLLPPVSEHLPSASVRGMAIVEINGWRPIRDTSPANTVALAPYFSTVTTSVNPSMFDATSGLVT